MLVPQHHTNICVLTNRTLTPGFQNQLESFMRQVRFPMHSLRWLRAHTTQPHDLSAVVRGHRPRLILVQDETALHEIANKPLTLNTARGSVYFIDDIPTVVLDSMRTVTGVPKLKAQNHFGFLLQQDLQKALRWYENKQRPEPAFSFEIVSNLAALRRLHETIRNSVLVGMDVETSGTGERAIITTSGYACLGADGVVRSFTVPFVDPMMRETADRRAGCMWTDTEFAEVIRVLQAAHASPVPKVLQNGSYDACYYLKYRMPPRNWIFDTAVGFHAIWPEIPKRIDFIASIACDHYRYWKDESDTEEKDDTKFSKVPRTEEGWFRYLQYSALDCHYLIPILAWETAVLHATPWALENYKTRMRQTVGPAIAMSMRGLRVNAELRDRIILAEQEAADTALATLRTMVDTPEFNPNSVPQVAALIYDVLKASPITKKGGTKRKLTKTGKVSQAGLRPTDEKTLNLLRTQHPLFDRIINQIFAAKKPANNVSKYGGQGLRLLNSRWLYKLNPTGTETGRYSSKKHDFWLGQQIQNPPYEMRAFVEPDPGYILWRADLSKADFWHTAFASEEPNMMEIVQRTDMDTHCLHAARFFQKPYEEIYEGYKQKADWVVHSTHGCRQNTKRIVYGANYLMGGFTLFLTIMGKEAMDATAVQMGRNIAGWTSNDYARFGQELIDFYFTELYPGLLPWLERRAHWVSTHGQVETCAGGCTRFFFGDVLRDNAAQRELASFYGQGGTASTINAALDRIYYEGFDSQECMVLWQLHDEIGGQVRAESLDQLKRVFAALHVENEMHGRRFTIPVEMEVGYGWGYRMCEWHPDITHDEITEADEKWKRKNPQFSTALTELMLSL